MPRGQNKQYCGITGIVYKETLDQLNLEPNYLILNLYGLGIPACISPLHDQDFFFEEDFNTELGDFWKVEFQNSTSDPVDHFNAFTGRVIKMKPKKPHWHIEVFFDHKSIDDVLEVVNKLHFANGYFQEIRNKKSLTRYFIHLDHKHKAQYSKYECIGFNGFKPETFFDLENDKEYISNSFEALRSMIVDNNIFYYHKFIDFLCSLDNKEWIKLATGVLCKPLMNYLNSRMYYCKDNNKESLIKLERENSDLIIRYRKLESEYKKLSNK